MLLGGRLPSMGTAFFGFFSDFLKREPISSHFLFVITIFAWLTRCGCSLIFVRNLGAC